MMAVIVIGLAATFCCQDDVVEALTMGNSAIDQTGWLGSSAKEAQRVHAAR